MAESPSPYHEFEYKSKKNTPNNCTNIVFMAYIMEKLTNSRLQLVESFVYAIKKAGHSEEQSACVFLCVLDACRTDIIQLQQQSQQEQQQ